MGDMDPKHWPVRNKAAAIELATLAATVAAIAVGNAAAAGDQVAELAVDLHFSERQAGKFAEFLVNSPGVAGNVLFRWAGARGIIVVDPESFDLEPAPVRLAWDTFAATFHAAVQVLVGEVCAYEARRTAAIMAPLQRVPLRETIFETDKDDGPLIDMGPMGTITPRAPSTQAQAIPVVDSGSSAGPTLLELSPSGVAVLGAAPADPLTSSPSGDAESRDGAPSSRPSLGVSSLDSAAGGDQPPAALSRKRKG